MENGILKVDNRGEVLRGVEVMPEKQQLLTDACTIIEQAQRKAYQSVNVILVKRNWLLGQRIKNEILSGGQRAEYGANIIEALSLFLQQRFGEGFDRSSLYKYVRFAETYPSLFHSNNEQITIVDTLWTQSTDKKKDTLWTQMPENGRIYDLLVSDDAILLSWSHYRELIKIEDAIVRQWYEQESKQQVWGVRTLQRNIASQYYHRLLQSPQQDAVKQEMQRLVKPLQDPKEYLKNPIIAEFLGFHNNTSFTESNLEQSILDHLPQFLMELGKGFAFVDRQKHIHTEKKDYYIDLVFYNFNLRCFVLIDLKTNTIDYQDAGQMDMYVKMFDERYRQEGHNPTIGILLCADTDEDVAKYSSLHDNNQLYMAKYLTYMPTQEELRREIEQQKAIFALQQQKKNDKETE